jgi:protein-disulfide isomerase
MRRKIVIALLFGIVAGAAVTLGFTRFWAGPDAMRAKLLANPEYLADHPEILERVRAVLMRRKLAAEGSQRVALIHGKWQFLSHVAFTPTLGRPDAPRVLLELTDYTCEPCRASAASVREAVTSRKDVRVAVLLYPIGGALAEYAARIAIAAYRQDPDKFADLHARLMEGRGELTQDRILDALRELKFDVDQVERESQSDETRRYLQQVRLFSEDMEISGVPAFLCEGKLVMGGVGSKQIQSLISPGDEPISAPATTGKSAERADAIQVSTKEGST